MKSIEHNFGNSRKLGRKHGQFHIVSKSVYSWDRGELSTKKSSMRRSKKKYTSRGSFVVIKSTVNFQVKAPMMSQRKIAIAVMI